MQVPRGQWGKLRLVWYTDPISIWCWGCEPAMRRIETVYQDDVDIEIVMGGLFEDFTPMREQFARMSGGQWKDSILAFMNAVAEHHRMPMDPAAMLESIDDFNSTWPGCIAAKAAEFQGAAPAKTYLRRLREASLVEGRAIHRKPVQVELASEAGLDAATFSAALDDGTAEAAFRADLEVCRSRGVTGFPTFEVGRGEVSVRIEGWQPWEAFDETLRKIEPALQPNTVDPVPRNALGILRRHGRCATREVAAVFGTTDDEAEILLEELESKGGVRRREAGTGLMWELATGASGSSAED